jgi:hypothetical protein
MAILGVAPEEENNFTIRVFTGGEPPRHFSEADIPLGIDFVQVDNHTVWSRKKAEKCEDEIPF